MHAELNIRSARLYTDLANHRNSSIAHGLVFAVGERLGRSDGDGIASVHAHGIEVLDRADDDDVVFEVAHDLKLVFFPAEHGFLDQSFVNRGEIETAGKDLEQLFAVVGHASAGAAERERRPHDHRETDFAGEFEAALEIVDQLLFWNVEA